MPNWCYTQISFHGNKNEIEDFCKKIDEWTCSKFSETDFGNNWLGNILIGAGLRDRIDADVNRLRCRGIVDYVGEVEHLTDTESVFVVEVETAWCPMMAMWNAVIKKLGYKTIGFSYMAEEPGCGLYQIYDPYGDYGERYYIDMYLEIEDADNEKIKKLSDIKYFTSDEILLKALQNMFDDNDSDLDTLIQKAKQYRFKNEDSYILIHKYELLDEDEIS